jgi:enoyl-[acyl-carrier-protein] reductase (NADH)
MKKSRKSSRNNINSGVIRQIKADVNTIFKTVYQGNGKPSIVTQLSSLETRLTTEYDSIKNQLSELSQDIKMRIVDSINIANDRCKSTEENYDLKLKNLNNEIELKFKNITDIVNEKFNSISYQIKQEFDKRKIDAAGVWNFKVALTTSILASLTSFFVVLLAELLKRII